MIERRRIAIVAAVGALVFAGVWLARSRKETKVHRDAAGVGDEVKLNDSIWTILEVDDLGHSIVATNGDAHVETRGRFIQIHYRVENRASKQETLLNVPHIIDATRTFSPIQDEADFVPKGTHTVKLETLQPSMAKEFYTIIDVPADATELRVQIAGLGTSGDKKLVDIE